MAWYIAIQNYDKPVSQHGIASCKTKYSPNKKAAEKNGCKARYFSRLVYIWRSRDSKLQQLIL